MGQLIRGQKAGFGSYHVCRQRCHCWGKAGCLHLGPIAEKKGGGAEKEREIKVLAHSVILHTQGDITFTFCHLADAFIQSNLQ